MSRQRIWDRLSATNASLAGMPHGHSRAKFKTLTQVTNTCVEILIAESLALPKRHCEIPPGMGCMDEEQAIQVKIYDKGTPESKMEYIRQRLEAAVLPGENRDQSAEPFGERSSDARDEFGEEKKERQYFRFVNDDREK
jgi:hypothetical protein